MTRIAISAIALTMAAGPALAEAHMDAANMIRSRDITGGVVYTTAEGDSFDSAIRMDAVDDGWSQIGEIEDLVLDRDGQMIGIVAEIGGFLDIGDKHVYLEAGDVSLVPVDDQTYGVVVGYTEEQLEELEGVDEGFWN